MAAAALLLPFGLGALLAALPWPAPRLRRALGIAGALWLIALALALLTAALSGTPAAVAVGGWPAPFGIILVADALAALLLLLAAVLALAALLHAAAADTDWPRRGFHALIQFQLFGIAGALLAADLFNLFVFLEVLLLASYGLLLLDPQRCPPATALHYVLLNVMGSSVFLLGVALVYGAAGTLNMSQLADRLGGLPAPDLALAGAGMLLLASVLALKAALVPLLAWLPDTYAAAPAPAAALFAVLTKVGLYGLVRLWTIADGTLAADLPGLPETPGGPPHPAAQLLGPLLLAAALATLASGACGVLAARGLRRLIAWLFPISIGTMLAGIAAGDVAGLAGALYYLVQSTLLAAGLFLLADLLRVAAGHSGDRRPSPVLGALFLLAAVGLAGMPPLSGFVGKALVLRAVQADAAGELWVWIWITVLGASIASTLALTRTGIRLFWPPVGARLPAAAPPPAALAPALALIATGPLLVLLAGPMTELTAAVSRQALSGKAYAVAVEALAPAPATGADGSTRAALARETP
jgi:multicomponent K+:H+ antiporter subunit D